jgi:hypothetical protein
MANGNKFNNGVWEQGTPEIVLAYQHDTPGQKVEEYVEGLQLQNEKKKLNAKKQFTQVFDNPLKGFPYNEEFEVKEIKEEAELTENYRKLAKHGMGTETPKSVKVGTEIDYYQKDGAKYMGKVTKMSKQSYTVRDDKTKKDHEFFYHDRIKAKQLLKQGDNIEEKVDPKVLKAIEIAMKMGGNMTGAVKAIEKIKKNLSKHKDVMNALQFANESKLPDFEVSFIEEDYRKVIKMYPSDKEWKKLITKHRKAIDAFRKDNVDLPMKVEDELIGWASETGEVSGKHDAEDFIISILDESIEKNMTLSLLEKAYDQNDVKKVQQLEKKLQGMLKEVEKTMKGSGLSAPAFNNVRSGIVKGLESIEKFYKIANTSSEETISEKIEYAEYKFKNKRDAQKGLDYFKSQQLIKLDINDDGLSQGELAIDAGKKDMTKQHKEVLKMLKPKVLTTESFNLNEGMSKLLSPAQQKGVLKKWNEPEGSTFAKDVYSNAKIANKKDFIVTSHSVKDGDYYLSLLGNAPEGKEDKPLTAANTNMNADIRKICKKWSTAGKTSPNPAGMCFLEIERELCDKKYNKFAAADTMVREVVWGMVEDIMGIKIKTA